MNIQKALEEQPWIYNKSPILIQRWRPGINLSEILKEMDCWVQIHKALFDYHTEGAAKDL